MWKAAEVEGRGRKRERERRSSDPHTIPARVRGTCPEFVTKLHPFFTLSQAIPCRAEVGEDCFEGVVE